VSGYAHADLEKPAALAMASKQRPSQTAAALSLAVTGSGAFTTFETHELIEASDLAQIAERAKRISYQPPGT